MKQMISLSIDLSKIDKSRIVAGKNGTSKYYGVTVLIEDVPDQWLWDKYDSMEGRSYGFDDEQ